MADTNTIYNGDDKSPLKTGGTRRKYSKKVKTTKGYRICNTKYTAGK
tara:strand:+ start:2004 stop:2144 length:141 start_codon:yes stop_codon:yes gene_type:complete